jgi:hypothetical protein
VEKYESKTGFAILPLPVESKTTKADTFIHS